MRDIWYGDRRDLVKWGTLVHIAQREHLKLIVHVPYFRRGPRPSLLTGGNSVTIQPAVWNFFRELSAVEALGRSVGCRIVVISEIFDPRQRQNYNKTVVDRLRKLPAPKVVLLDPDTGLAPARPSAEHVTPTDVQVVWKTINHGDWLVLYQHASRTRTWRTDARQRFVAVCGVQDCEELTAPDISADVAFFAVNRP